MLKQLFQHRWICFVEGGLTLSLGLGLLTLRHLVDDRLMGLFVAASVLLGTGFVLVASGLLDLAVAVEVTAHRRTPRAAMLWWFPGAIGLALGLATIAAPRVTMCVVASVAGVHALFIAALHLAALPGFRRHPAKRHGLLVSAVLSVFLAALLMLGALGTEAMAAKAVGLYASYFGLSLMLLGSQLTRPHHPLAVS